jgi:prepilin-type N-terminal cleavage/methylation domain-containing protein
MKPIKINSAHQRAFTLVELLVVIAIIMALAFFAIMGGGRLLENSRKVKAMDQFRNFGVGMTLFVGDYQKPPIPQSKLPGGWDTIYGDPGGKYTTEFLVSALKGDLTDEEGNYTYGDETFSGKAANPRNETYVIFPYSADKKYGVGNDGRLYDPWGGEVMVGINGFKSTSGVLVPFNNGGSDLRMHTWGLAEYTETKPKEQAYVFWSYGKDKKKGKNAPNVGSVVPFQNSDDVISW